jgi:hypothetical protein
LDFKKLANGAVKVQGSDTTMPENDTNVGAKTSFSRDSSLKIGAK